MAKEHYLICLYRRNQVWGDTIRFDVVDQNLLSRGMVGSTVDVSAILLLKLRVHHRTCGLIVECI